MEDSIVVAKPCEASAIAALAAQRGTTRPLILSFFCAGVPSQKATDRLIGDLGVDRSKLTELRYRGNGWPGQFVAVDSDGRAGAMTYEESWGNVLGRELQWRCKICPDGVGESSDITAGDYWQSDSAGYPLFDEADGTSVIIARTQRGHDIVLAAVEAGAISASPVSITTLRPIQPLQVMRRSELGPRLVGVVAAGGTVPRFLGFRLATLASRHPVKSLRSGFGAFRRFRAAR